MYEYLLKLHLSIVFAIGPIYKILIVLSTYLKIY